MKTLALPGRLPRLVLAMACAMSCHAAIAAPLWCTGTLANLYVDKNGNAFASPSWHTNYVGICNVNQSTASGVTPVSCLAWLSMARSAMQRAVPVTLYYHDASVASCSALPTYENSPTPYYVMLNQ